jgi:phosphoserine phosphatase
MEGPMIKHHLLVSDFDQTLSFNDAGHVLAELLGITGFAEKVAGLSRLHLVQEGAELAYLLRHDPEFRRVRRADLIEVGRRVRLKRNIDLLIRILERGIDGYRFDFYVVSAAPEEVVKAALDGIVPADNIIGTRFSYHSETEEIDSVLQVPAGFGKVTALDDLRSRLGVPGDRVVYVGDGGSDLHVMLHVNRGDGLTIAVSEAKFIAQIARRTIITDDALGVLVPILEDVMEFGPVQVRKVLENHGLLIQDWAKGRTDWVTIRESGNHAKLSLEEATG